jgi:hypothetical protein
VLAGALTSGAPRGGPTAKPGGYAKEFPVPLPRDRGARVSEEY